MIGPPTETVEQCRQNLIGFAVGVFRIGEMVEATLRDLDVEGFNIRLHDETSPVGKSFLYSHEPMEGNGPTFGEQLESPGGLSLCAPLNIPGRQWVLRFSPTKEFLSTHRTRQAWGVLAAGLLVTALLVRRLLILINRAAKIQRLATGLSKLNEELEGEIAERRRAEEALRESKELYQTLFENTTVGTGIADTDGNLIAYNSAMLRPGGYTREDIAKIGNVGHLYADPDARDQALAIAQKQGFLLQHEVQFKRKDGTSYDTLLTLTPVVIQGKSCWQSVVDDITERKQSEEERAQHARELEKAFHDLQGTQQQLIQSAKLAAIGELVSGTAHELNNPLTGVWGTSQLIMRREIDETLRGDLEVIHQEVSRAVKIVQNLLSFARYHTPEKRNASINEALEKALELRIYEMKVGGIEVETELQRDLPETWFDFHEMQQVFLNNDRQRGAGYDRGPRQGQAISQDTEG